MDIREAVTPPYVTDQMLGIWRPFWSNFVQTWYFHRADTGQTAWTVPEGARLRVTFVEEGSALFQAIREASQGPVDDRPPVCGLCWTPQLLGTLLLTCSNPLCPALGTPVCPGCRLPHSTSALTLCDLCAHTIFEPRASPPQWPPWRAVVALEEWAQRRRDDAEYRLQPHELFTGSRTEAFYALCPAWRGRGRGRAYEFLARAAGRGCLAYRALDEAFSRERLQAAATARGSDSGPGPGAASGGDAVRSSGDEAIMTVSTASTCSMSVSSW